MNDWVDLEQATPRKVETTIKAAMFEQMKHPISFRSCWNSKIDIYIHQIETALRVLSMDPPRIILADEVGLGKTIEALLVLKELISLGKVKSALLVLPSNLLNQWQYEMETKFSLYPIIIKKGTLMEELEDDNTGLYLVSVDYAKRHTEAFTKHKWDMVIFDEAHHLRRHLRNRKRVETTQKYNLGRALAQKTHALLLLTATPMQLNEFEFFSLLAIVDENIFPTFEDFEYYYQTLLPRVIDTLHKITNEQDINIPEMHLLYQRGRECLNYFELPSLPNECEDLSDIKKFLQSLIILPEIMIRHRKREEFPGLPPREISTIPIKYTNMEHCLYNDLTHFFKEVYRISMEQKNPSLGFTTIIYQQMLTSSPVALANSFRRRIKNIEEILSNIYISFDEESLQEIEVPRLLPQSPVSTEIRMLQDFLIRLEELPVDSKLKILIKLVANILIKHPDEKILIFTRFIDTQNYLAEMLGEHFEVVKFNGRMNIREKDENVKKFRKSANIMISTESGGEGRNFQFCHILINYDLPWNPVRLEQRIGRIDRIGQEKKVVIYNIAIDGTVEERIYEVLVNRIFSFQNLIGTADTILGNIETDIAKVVLAQEKLLEEEYDRFTEILNAKVEKAKAASKYFDRLTTFRKKGVERSLASKEVFRKFPKRELENFIISYIASLNKTSVHDINGKCYSIYIPKLSELGNRYEIKFNVTFDRNVAVSEGNIEFLTVDHPFIKNVLTSILSKNKSIISFEKNINVNSEIYWCFYGGIDEGYYIVCTGKGYAVAVSPESAVHSTYYDVDNSVMYPVESTMAVKKFHERARLIAEREMNYPKGGVELKCVRVINWDILRKCDEH